MPGLTVSFDLPSFKGDMARLADQVAKGHRVGMEAVAEGMKTDMFQMVDRVWPGTKLANAIGAAVDDSRSTPGRLHAVVFAKSKNADRILDGFAKGAVIRGKHGQYLCIPTDYAPKKPWGEHWWTPALLIERFGRARIHVQWKPNGVGVVWLSNVVRAKNRRGYREATKRRLDAGRAEISVPVLFLVPLARLKKRLDPEAILAKWADLAPAIIETAIEAVINDA